MKRTNFEKKMYQGLFYKIQIMSSDNGLVLDRRLDIIWRMIRPMAYISLRRSDAYMRQ